VTNNTNNANDVVPSNELFDSFRQRKSKRKRVGLGFAKKATDILMNLIESILPRGGLEWDLIAVRFNEVTDEGRSGTALKHPKESSFSFLPVAAVSKLQNNI
jgi:hypothetical protein